MQLLSLSIPPTLLGGPCTNITATGTESVSPINGNGNLVFVNYSLNWLYIALGNTPAVSINMATALLIDANSAVQISVGGGSWWVATQLAYVGGGALPSSVTAGGLLSVIQVAVPVVTP